MTNDACRGRFHDEPGAVLIENPPPVGTEVLLMLTDFGNPLVFAYGGRPQLEPGISTLAKDARALGLRSPGVPQGSGIKAGQCTDGLDNDPNGHADGCDYSCVPHYDFGGGDFDHVHVFEQTSVASRRAAAPPLRCNASI